MHSRY